MELPKDPETLEKFYIGIAKGFSVMDAAYEFQANVVEIFTGVRPPTNPAHHLVKGMLVELGRDDTCPEMVKFYLNEITNFGKKQKS